MEKTLNKEQLRAINHKDGPLLIIAGAGTGKTTVVTERIKKLILSGQVKPAEILALTFTEKASVEMQGRLDEVLPYGYTNLWVSTFHSFCDRVLRSEAIQIGLNPKYTLIGESEATSLVRTNLFNFELDYFRPLGNPSKFIGAMLSHFSRLQDEDVTPDQYTAWIEKKSIETNDTSSDEDKLEIAKWKELSAAYKKYSQLKIDQGLMDFGDLIVNTLKLFRNRPNVLGQYQDKFKHILVDEYQDTNFAQNQLAVLLASRRRNITVCGDDDQAIYRFRGAAISNIIQFRHTYPDAAIVVLTKNYRSTQEILDKAYDLVQFNNPDRLEVTEKINKHLLSASKVKGDPIVFIHEDRVENEADRVSEEISKLVGQDDYLWNDCAILVRANSHADPFVKSLDRHGIPYQFLGPEKLFKQPEVIELISLLRVLNNIGDSVAMYKLLSIEGLGVPPLDLAKLSAYAKKNNIALFEACEAVTNIANISKTGSDAITSILQILITQIGLANKESAGQILYNFLSETGLINSIVSPDTSLAQKRATNISKLFDKLKTYEVDHDDATVPKVVDWIDLAMEIGESPLAANSDWSAEDAVNIITVHSSKGLEFPVVFLVNLVSQRFPTQQRRETIPIPDELIKEVLSTGDYHSQEERRLFYVGMTRAKNKLYFTAANYYGDAKREKSLSPFIFEALGENATARELSQDNAKQLSLLDFNQGSRPAKIHNPMPLHVDYLSYSQIETFKVCPMHYKLAYIYRIPTPPSASQSFGIALHSTMKAFYDLGKGSLMADKDIRSLLKNNWISQGYDSKEHEKKFFEKAVVYIGGFLKYGFDKEIVPALMEQKFILPLYKKGEPPLKVGGIIDRVDVASDGTIEIIDYKTGANVPSQKDVDKNLQMTFYALAATTLRDKPFGVTPDNVKLSLYYFDEQIKITTTRTKQQLEEAVAEIFSVRDQIEHSDFKCSGNILCEKCEYSLFCKVDE